MLNPFTTAGKYMRSQKFIFLLSTGFTLFVNASISRYLIWLLFFNAAKVSLSFRNASDFVLIKLMRR